MVSEKVSVTLPQGIHLKPAGTICEAAIRFESKIHFETESGKNANVKSVLSILAAGITYGEVITVVCEGEDEKEAMEALKKLL